MSTSQKEAVVTAVATILGKSFIQGSTNVKETITADQLTSLREVIFAGIISGEIAFNKDTSDEKAVRRYVNGMIDNHFRKAKELNGGATYSVKTSGTGRGARDPQLSALRKLSKNYDSGSPEFNKVQSAIAARESQLTADKQAALAEKKRTATLKNIDASSLPPELQSLISE